MKQLVILFIYLSCNLISFAQISTIQKAAESGDIDAQKYMAEAYIEGDKGVEKNLKKAFDWYLKAARQNDAEAQYQTYLLYVENPIIYNDKDYIDITEEAFAYLVKSASQGYAPALANWGYVLEFQYKEYYAAFKCYKEGAEKLHPSALLLLGDCYLYGKGTVQNVVEAERCYQLALENNGSSIAYVRLAYCALHKQDYAKAKNYYEEAMKLGIPNAYEGMAYLYA